MSRSFSKESIADRVFDIFIYIVMIFVFVVTLYPFLNILAISLNDSNDAMRGGIGIFPRIFTLKNYQEIFKYQNLTHAFLISVLRTVIGGVLGVISTCMVSYVLSRKDFMYRKLFTTLFVITMYVGGGMIPDYMLMRHLGLLNNFWVYILPGLINTYNVLVVRSFIDGIPYSLQESAKLDGANDFVIFYKIVMPLCVPVIATISLFIAVGQWNSWMDTYIYASSRQNLSTLQYEMVKILNNTSAASGAGQSLINANDPSAAQTVSPTSIRMAITIVATIPILLVYPFVQKYFISGITIGAVKG